MSDTQTKEKRQVVIPVNTTVGKRFNDIREVLTAKHGFRPTASQTMEYILSQYEKAAPQ